ncbi:MAG: endonuclease/exonuclease/phosphatase family protein [Phycisphaerales bacterium]|nr:endonuclease/exonuclease/phosphatase family protein [Phycisphaerales bacterium]
MNPPVPVRVVTMNVREGLGTLGSLATESTGDFLTTNDDDGMGPNSGLNPDIVCLQECRSSANLTAFRDAFLPGYQFYRITQTDAGGNFNCAFVRPFWNVLDADSINTPGPRNVLRITIEVPFALEPLTLYVCHLKAFTDGSSTATRTAEADFLGELVYDDINLGLDLDDNGSREFQGGSFALLGDLNSNSNFDGSLDGIFTHATLSTPTGLLDLPVETLFGRTVGGSPQIVTYQGSPQGRLDYVCMDDVTATIFDIDSSGSYSQSEINMMGFVYSSGDDSGAMANGNSSATFNASDHRPVIFDMLLPRDPNGFFDLRDLNGNQMIDGDDLAIWERLFAMGSAPDVNFDFVVDADDRVYMKEGVRANELSDVSTR